MSRAVLIPRSHSRLLALQESDHQALQRAVAEAARQEHQRIIEAQKRIVSQIDVMPEIRAKQKLIAERAKLKAYHHQRDLNREFFVYDVDANGALNFTEMAVCIEDHSRQFLPLIRRYLWHRQVRSSCA
jgi:hypothetical protein